MLYLCIWDSQLTYCSYTCQTSVEASNALTLLVSTIRPQISLHNYTFTAHLMKLIDDAVSEFQSSALSLWRPSQGCWSTMRSRLKPLSDRWSSCCELSRLSNPHSQAHSASVGHLAPGRLHFSRQMCCSRSNDGSSAAVLVSTEQWWNVQVDHLISCRVWIKQMGMSQIISSFSPSRALEEHSPLPSRWFPTYWDLHLQDGVYRQ